MHPLLRLPSCFFAIIQRLGKGHLSWLLVTMVLLSTPGADTARAQVAPPPPQASRLPAGLSNPDSLRAWRPRPPSADTLQIKTWLKQSQRLISTSFDSARTMALAAVDLAWRRGQDKGLAYGLSMLASSYYYADDAPAAQRTYEQLLWAAGSCHRPELVGAAYMGLGLVARDLDNWVGAERYFVRAQRAYAASRPRELDGELGVLANRAYNFLDIDSVARARPLVRQAVALLRQFPAARHPAKYQLLLGIIQKKSQQFDSAAVTFGRAARLAHTTHDLNPEAEALEHLAELALRRHDYPLALSQAKQAEVLFHELGDTQEADALKSQATALAGLHRPEAYATLHRYIVLYDSANGKQQARDVAMAQARFDRAGQQARIQALEQQRRIAGLEEEQRTVRSRLLLGGVVGGGALLVMGFVGAYRRRQRRREAALRHQLAADLHDDVGSLLTRIALQTDLMQEGLGQPGQQQAQLAEVADSSRMAVRQLNDVVWNLDAKNDSVPNLLDRLRDYAHEVLVPTGRDVRFVADETIGASPDLSAAVRRHLYLIFKEALHNVLKYAPADATVTVTLHRAGHLLTLAVENTGPGTPASAIPAPGRGSGHGLRNIQERSTTLGGTAQTQALPDGGFAVRVSVPV